MPEINKTRAVGGRRNPSAYVVVGTPIPFVFFLEKTSKSPFYRFLPKKCEFQINLPTTHKPKIVMIMKKCIMYCENTDFAKNAQFWLLI